MHRLMSHLPPRTHHNDVSLLQWSLDRYFDWLIDWSAGPRHRIGSDQVSYLSICSGGSVFTAQPLLEKKVNSREPTLVIPNASMERIPAKGMWFHGDAAARSVLQKTGLLALALIISSNRTVYINHIDCLFLPMSCIHISNE